MLHENFGGETRYRAIRLKAWTVFLILSSPMGMFALLPPYQGPQAHFMSMFTIRTGQTAMILQDVLLNAPGLRPIQARGLGNLLTSIWRKWWGRPLMATDM